MKPSRHGLVMPRLFGDSGCKICAVNYTMEACTQGTELGSRTTIKSSSHSPKPATCKWAEPCCSWGGESLIIRGYVIDRPWWWVEQGRLNINPATCEKPILSEVAARFPTRIVERESESGTQHATSKVATLNEAMQLTVAGQEAVLYFTPRGVRQFV